MNDNQRSENKEEAREVEIEEFLAIRKDAGQKIDPETAEVCWDYAQVLDPYGIVRTCRMNVTALGERTSLALRTVTFGSSSATFPKQPKARCGKSINGG